METRPAYKGELTKNIEEGKEKYIKTPVGPQTWGNGASRRESAST